MTETDTPLLGPGRELTQGTAQAGMAIVTAVRERATALRERRYALDRVAWSDRTAADRIVEQHRSADDPPFRAMTKPEFTAFRDAAQTGHSDFETHTATSTDWEVRVTVGPMPDGRGWGLAAEGLRDADGPGSSGINRVQALVVVQKETDAKKIADELLQDGPAKVKRLQEFGEYATDRVDQAHTEVRETREQLLARTKAAVEQVWRHEPGLVDRMIQPTAKDRQDGLDHNGALGALATELEKLKERGYEMVDVLRRIERTEALLRANNPAAMACSFVQRMSPEFSVINLDDDESAHERAAAPGAGARGTAPAPPRAPSEDEIAAETALGAALRRDGLADVVRRAPGFDRLRAELAELHGQGRSLDTLLADLPEQRIQDANDSASYLRAVVEKRATVEPLRRTLPNLGSAVELVERSMPHDTAQAVTGCEAWPGLAGRIMAWQAEGLPIGDMLATLPAKHIQSARNPAAFAGILLNSRVQSRRKANAPDTATEQTGVVEGDGPLAPPAPAAGRDSVPPPPVAPEELDPSSAVDRAALRICLGSGTVRQDAEIKRRLADLPDGPGDRAASGQPPVESSDEARADLAERAAAAAESTPDDPVTSEREDLAGQDTARTEERIAAAAHADRTYRIPGQPPGTPPSPRPRITQPVPGPAVPQRTLSNHPRPHR